MNSISKLSSDQEGSLFRGSYSLYFRKVFYALLLQNVTKRYSPSVPTACVSLNKVTKAINLVFGDWFFTLTEVEQAFILEHEMMHLAFDHLYYDFVDQHKANIACDLSVNSWLRDEMIQLLGKDPKIGGIPPLFATNYGLPEKESVQYYYDMLTDAQDKKDKGEPYNSKLDPLLNDGNCGDGLGDFEPFDGTAEEMEVQKVLTDTIKRATVNKLTEQQRGSYPELMDMIKELFEIKESQVNWKRETRQFIGRNEKKDYRKTYLRLNKRFPLAKGRKSKYKAKIGFVVDQSGSMDNASIEAGFNEIYHLYKQGVSITVIEADTDVANHYEYKGKPIKTRSASGGTYMSPAITFANTLSDLNGVIVFTDGYIESDPVVSKLPLLWIVTSNGTPSINTPHKILKMGDQIDR